MFYSIEALIIVGLYVGAVAIVTVHTPTYHPKVWDSEEQVIRTMKDEKSESTNLKQFNTERNINSAIISPRPDAPYLIAGGGQDAMSVTTTAAKQGNFHCSFFDYVFDDELGKIEGHFGPVNTLAIAPHGKAYTSGGEEGYVRINHLPPDYFEAYNRKVAEAFGRDWP